MMPSTQRLIGSLTLAFTAFVFTPAYAQPVIGIDEKSAAAMQELIQSAQQHQQAGQWDKAMEATQRLVQLQRDFLPITASDLAESLAVLGDLQAASGEWQGAERSFQESLQLLSDNLGADDWRTIDARLLLDELKLWQRLSDLQRMQLERSGELQQQQMALYQAGEFDKSVSVAQQAIQIEKGIVGANHPQIAESLDTLAVMYLNQGKLANAETLYAESMGIRKKVFGERHPEYARSLTNQAGLHLSKGEPANSIPLFQQVLEIYKKTVGVTDPSYIETLDNLAKAHSAMAQNTIAGQYYQQALAAAEEHVDKQNPLYGRILNNVATHYSAVGDFDRALKLHQQSLELQERSFGKDDPSYAVGLDNIALTYQGLGDFVNADKALLEALELRKQSLGVEHPDYGQSLSNLALNYAKMGDYAKSDRLYQQSLEITKNVLGEKHPTYANALNNRGHGLLIVGDFENAKPLLMEALEVYRDVYGEQHPGFVSCTTNLGQLSMELGEWEQANARFQQALDITAELFGKQSPQYSETLTLLGTVAFRTRHFADAEQQLEEALKIASATLGETHPKTLAAQASLATAYFTQNKHAQADALFQRALEGRRELLENTSRAQSERQQLSMASGLRFELDTYLSLLARADVPKENAFRQVLAWKGSTLVRQRQMRQIADDDSIAPVFEQLQHVSSQLATLSRVEPTTEKQAVWQTQIAELTDAKEKLEAELSQKNAEFRESPKPVAIEDLRAALPPDAALLDFFEYARIDPTKPAQYGIPSLIAFVVQRSGDVAMVDLGPVAPVGEAIDTWRQSFGTSRDGIAAGQTLRKTIWQPLEKHLGETDLVLVSVDGVLGRLPLQALPGKKPNTYLVEDHRLAFIPVPQLLPSLVAGQPPEPAANSLLVMGDVNYDAESNPAEKIASNSLSTAMVRGSDTHFSNLPGTVGEIATIKSVFSQQAEASSADVMSLGQDDATEQAFRAAASQYRTLHLATHGFFAAADKQSALASDTKRTGPQTLASQRDQIVRGFNPGLLSGLAFSGANRKPELDQDDGILTADEIAALRLDNVDLVVLSACETGLGEVAGGEGLLGVQRSFQVAGARSTVASLWQVGDVATKLLMERFYRNLWEKKMSKLDALREAQLHLLNHPEEVLANESFRGDRRVRPAKNKTQPNRLSPQFWAAFSLSGDWR
ncbi:CHAT domain-containing tetratricopeptide repeat protein [Rosistilla oblonga]|uniref:CHAT domain-containing tetratricopeptide repeat protein n=1 Tax=Rosistilla oblonga TaxID=2527990 RepID=UPI003A97C701